MELNVKVGDKVVYYGNTREITEVIKITPTGRIRVAYNPSLQFDKHGWEMGGGTWHRASIKELTPEIKIEILQEKVIAHCRNKLRNLKLDYETAVKLLEVLEGGQEDHEK